MDKWEEELKNNVNRTIPPIIDERIQKTLNHLPRKRRPRSFYYAAIAIIASIFIVFSASLFSPAVAGTFKAFPVIGSIFKIIGDISEQKGSEKELTTLLGEEIEIGGRKIIFTESLYDGSTIHIGYLIESPEIDEVFWDEFFSDLQLSINGKSLISGYGVGNRGDFLENGNYAGIFTIDIDKEELPADQFKLGIHSRYENESWKVTLPIVLQGKNQSFLVNQTKTAKDLDMHFDKITFFPTSTELAFRVVMDEEKSEKYMNMDYQVVDNDGRVLQMLSGGGSGGDENGQMLWTYNYYFEPLDNLPQSITVRPFLYSTNEEELEIVKEKWIGKEMMLSQGEIGQVKILNVDIKDDIAAVTLEADGADTYQQADNVWIENMNGEGYFTDQKLQRVEGSINQYQLTTRLEGDHIDELYIVTSKLHAPNFLKDLEVTIELNEIGNEDEK